MMAWSLVFLLCLVDGLLCRELMKAWDRQEKTGRRNGRESGGNHGKG